MTMHAFRCKNCSRLHHAEHAGENLVPHACVVCGKGVVFEHERLAGLLLKPGIKPEEVKEIAGRIAKCDPATKALIPDNWEVLHEATDARLKELGLKREHVVQHTPKSVSKPTDTPKHVKAEATEGMKTTDKA